MASGIPSVKLIILAVIRKLLSVEDEPKHIDDEEALIKLIEEISRDPNHRLTWLTKILRVVSDTKNEETKSLSPDVQFEIFMGYLRDILDKDIFTQFLKELFSGYQPNVNHQCIASLMKQGIVRRVYTTNFDTLIEEACEHQGLKKGQDFDVVFKDFTPTDLQTPKVLIVKLHGCVSEPTTIVTCYDELIQTDPYPFCKREYYSLTYCPTNGVHLCSPVLASIF